MPTFQPLYFSGGRYAAATDRKLIASLIASETNGTRVSGVIPAGTTTASLLVTSAGANTISIASGMCMIPDNTAPNATSGMYLAGIQGSAETRSFSTNNSTNTRTDVVYAVVDETPYTIIKKKIDTNVFTLTTSEAHGFKVGETVSVSGVDEIFDGFYVITVVTSTTFSYEKTADNVTEENVRAEVRLGARWAAVTTKAINASTNTVTLAISTTVGEYGGSQFAAGDAGQVVTVKGVDNVIDGTYVLASASSSQVTFLVNKPVAAISPAATVTNSYSSVSVARVPFSIKIDEGNAGTFNAKTKIRLATYTVPAGGGSLANVTDARQFTTTMGGVHYYNSTATAPAAVAGRFRYNTVSNTLEYYTTSWNTILQLGTTATTAAAGNHNHDSLYAASGHLHTGVYAATSHTHSFDDITNTPENEDPTCTFVGVDAPKSDGATSSTSISVSATSFTTLTGISAVISLSAATYCMVQWSCQASAGSSGEIYVAPSVSGATTVSASVTGGTSSHQSAATDGTAYGDGDIGVNRTTSTVQLTGTRIVKLNSGTNNVNLQAYRVTANGSVIYPVVRVIPLRFV